MEGNLIFGLPAICGVIPLLVYIILAFKKGMNTIVNVVVCVLMVMRMLVIHRGGSLYQKVCIMYHIQHGNST